MPQDCVDALRSRFYTALQDGKVTESEAVDLIDQCRRDGVSQSERRHLNQLFAAHEDHFEPAARTQLMAFLTDEAAVVPDEGVDVADGTGRKDLPDPPVLAKDWNTLKYAWVDGSLFVEGVSDTDVRQGMIDDCYFMASLAAIARQSPETIKNAIRDNHDGTYTVRFFSAWFASRRVTEITVDGQLPTRAGGLHYGRSNDKKELWVALMEKAYAQWKGGYDRIGNGGSAFTVLSSLTGRRVGYHPVNVGEREADLFRKIAESLSRRQAVVVGTHGTAQAELYRRTGIRVDHAYSVTRAYTGTDGVPYLELRNPWGEIEPDNNGADDGVFRIDMPTFMKLFNATYIS